MRVAVAGAGIAGLTSAIALAARGFKVDVYERAARLEEIGAGIQLSPNATSVLEQLGVMAELRERVSEPETLAIRDALTGTLLSRLPLGRSCRERYGAPYVTLHRADLQQALFATARRHDGIAFAFGASVEAIEARSSGVNFMAGGAGRHADLLVAADGVHSRIRMEHFRQSGPKSLGRTAWRATLDSAVTAHLVALDEVGLWLGAGGHLVHYPILGGGKLNLVVIAKGETPDPPMSPFGLAARKLAELSSSWIASPLLAIDAHEEWTTTNVVLVGDAAHGMAPSSAQGGAQAIEDAWVLAEVLAQSKSEVQRALATFSRLRQSRVQRVAGAAQRNLNAFELEGVPARLRNILLRVLPATLFNLQLDWLFGWKPK